MRTLLAILLASALASAQAPSQELKSAAAVLDRYKQALGGAEAIQKVQWETVRGELEGSGLPGRIPFVYYAKGFKNLMRISRPDGSEIQSGFDGTTSWTIGPQGTTIDKDTPVEANRRDADLQYPLHQPDYFRKLELTGVTDFEGHRCYWLHGTTNWGKDNNQFYDVQTGLLVGYRFEDDVSKATWIVRFDDYKSFGGRLVATRNTSRSGNHSRTFIYDSVSYDPVPDSIFEIPAAVKALMK